jgi:cysteine desulfuration protein SufE
MPSPMQDKTHEFPPDIESLVAEFHEMEDWDERYTVLLDLGRELPRLPADLQTEANRVHGCMSTVWMVIDIPAGSGEQPVQIRADSDSLIVRGLIVVLLSYYAGKTPTEVIDADPAGLFSQLGLNQHLSPNRRNGLYSMVGRIRETCIRHLAASGG